MDISNMSAEQLRELAAEKENSRAKSEHDILTLYRISISTLHMSA